MPNVELIYDRDCPNVAEVRAHLLKAFAGLGQTPRWTEHLIGDPDAPEYARGFGSPTILVDARDVAGAAPAGETCCRLYSNDSGGLSPVPPISQIAAALAAAVAARRPGGMSRWRSSAAVLPGIAVALLPKLACPACWPAYAGLLSALGLSFLMQSTWLLPLTAGFLALAVGGLAFRARKRRGYGPFAVGIVALPIVLLGKFSLESDAALYAGIGLLVAASLWNSWPSRRRAGGLP